ncbi:hypothetical protein [Bifidobacterium biavatii]|uniref:Lipoprotein n=1 Tax=Bifidobacterium biavatii DSM 23969 TaxID=1437608 RepID=A0A087A1R7_9BIFI|nr:hypothetical protein [Bifidobacterium biavatii]KFI52717.1 hypothetical protein BBIA_0399 [Bifidobacterium biavatii DSM 23969]
MAAKRRIILIIGIAIVVVLACAIAVSGQNRSVSTGSDVAANCAISYAKSYDSAQAYLDDVHPDLVAKATLGEPALSWSGNAVTFTAHLLDVKAGTYQAGDDVKLRFACNSVASFMPDGYRTGDTVIVLANGGTLRQPESVWPFDEQTYDSLTVD